LRAICAPDEDGSVRRSGKHAQLNKRTVALVLAGLLATGMVLCLAPSAWAYPTGWSSDSTVVSSEAASDIDIASIGSTVQVVYINTSDVSIQVSAGGNIVAERSMYFNHKNMTGGSVVIGTDNPATTWYLAEGCTQPGFEEFITVQNANDQDADVTLSYMVEGSSAPVEIHRTVPAKSRGTVRVSDTIDPSRNVSTKVTSGVPVVAERPMYFNYNGAWDGGHDNIGIKELSDEWYLAEGCTRDGFDEWVTIQNPSMNNIGVSVDYMMGDGSVSGAIFTIAPYSRLTVNVNDPNPKVGVGPGKDVSCHILADAPVAVERPMYFKYNGAWTGGHIGSGYPMIDR
jgi:hypothetical protein